MSKLLTRDSVIYDAIVFNFFFSGEGVSQNY